MALRAERLTKNQEVSRALPYSRIEPNTKPTHTTSESKLIEFKGKEVSKRKLETKGKEIMDSSEGIRCFKCNEIGHRSSDCPRRKFANVTQCEPEEDYDEQETV